MEFLKGVYYHLTFSFLLLVFSKECASLDLIKDALLTSGFFLVLQYEDDALILLKGDSAHVT